VPSAGSQLNGIARKDVGNCEESHERRYKNEKFHLSENVKKSYIIGKKANGVLEQLRKEELAAFCPRRGEIDQTMPAL